MTTHSTESGEPAAQKRFVPALIIAVCLYIALDLLDAFINLPLRHTSSTLSAVMLRALGMDITQDGTVLTTPNYIFDVVPACSGSTTLSVLLAACVIWSGIHPRLTPLRRIVAILLSVPCALFANALRVALLVGLGDFFLNPIEGLPHDLIGIIALLLGLAMMLFLSESLATNLQSRQIPVRAKLCFCFATALILFMPVWAWLYIDWIASPGRLVDALIILGAWSALIAVAVNAVPDRNKPGASMLLALLVITGLLFTSGNFLNLRWTQGLSLNLLIWTLIWGTRGRRAATLAIPIVFIALSGHPLVTVRIARTIESFSGLYSQPMALTVKLLAIALLGYVAYRIKCAQPPAVNDGDANPQHAHAALNLTLLLLIVTLMGHLLYNSRAAQTDVPRHLELSYLLDGWVGSELSVSQSASDTLGRDNIYTRKYNQDGKSVQVIITSTGGDRRQAHRPEACMTSVGWEIIEREQSEVTVNGETQPAARLLLQIDDLQTDFYYWYTDGEYTTSSYNDMFRKDLLRRLKGIRTDWFVFRIMARTKDDSLEDFLTVFNPVIAEGRAPGNAP